MHWFGLVLATAGALSGPVQALDGRSVYVRTCAACHALGDKGAWAPRLQAGTDALLASVRRGKGAMPPKGGNANLSDAEAEAAVHYMISVLQP